jgi:magnesium-transporting ATPase (P-type)
LPTTYLIRKSKSDIQIEVRNEGVQIQRALETALNSNFNTMEEKIKERFEVQSQQLKVINVLLIIVLIGLGIMFYFK